MKQIIIGTAGHVDHGKTALTRALTGTDTDRLAEEKKRGITIEIGFAKLTLPNGQAASIIDVPGHERFISNMLVGAAGMDVCLLIVAADEGVMPQTREHLGILSLLGVQGGIIVLTKADLVDAEWLEAIGEETRQHMAGTFLERAPMVAVSAVTGQGLDELKACIAGAVAHAAPRSAQAPARLSVDRVFSADGFGTVVTGTLIEGRLAVGDEVMLYPKGLKAKVRGLQNHDTPVRELFAGMRAAVNLSGIERRAVTRGDVLAASQSLRTTQKLDVQLTALGDAPFAIKNDSSLHLHHGTAEVLCKCVLLGRAALNPGETCFAQLRLAAPLCVKNGDRFVARFFSPTVTVAGGTVLNIAPTWRRRNDPAVIAGLAARASGSDEARVLQILRDFGQAAPAALAEAAGLSRGEIDALLGKLTARGETVSLGGQYMARAAFDALWEKTAALLAAYHKAEPLKPGMPRGELKSKLGVSAGWDALLAGFSEEFSLRLDGPAVALHGFSVVWSPAQAALRDELEALYLDMALAPESVAEVEGRFAGRVDVCRQVMARLIREGVLVPLSAEVLVHKTHYAAALETLKHAFAQAPELPLGTLRDALGVSRKYALLFLEHCDKNAITKKIGEVRKLLV